MAFVLPNGKKIDEEGLCDAFGDSNGARNYFLDIETGDVGCIENNSKLKNRVSDKKRFIEVPKVSIVRQLEWLRGLARELILPDDNAELAQGLLRILDPAHPGSALEKFNKCMEVIEKDRGGWINAWVQWQGDHCWEEMCEWLTGLPIEIEDRIELFCDCELCKLIENGPHTVGDFMEATQKQERKQKKKTI